MDKICNKTIDYMIEKNVINAEKKEIYLYGMKLTIYNIIYALIILSLCFALKRDIFELVLFYFSYMSIRKYAGGYHAPNIILCMFLFGLTYYLLDYFLLLASNLHFSIVLILSTILVILIYFNSPIDCENKRLNEKEKRVYKRCALCLSVFWLICMIIMFEMQLSCYLIIFYTFLNIYIFQLI